MALAEMGFGLNGIGLNGYWPNWELDQVALDKMALDKMGLDEVAIPQSQFWFEVQFLKVLPISWLDNETIIMYVNWMCIFKAIM